MTMTIETTPDKLGEALQGVFDGIAADWGQLSYVDLLVDTHRSLQAEHSAYFANESDPAGTPWPPLKPATIKRKGHSQILVDTRRLRRSLTQRTGDSISEIISEPGPTGQHGLSYGTSVPYSIFHQEPALAPGGKLPQRAHVGTNEEFVGKLAKKTADATVRKLQERQQ